MNNKIANPKASGPLVGVKVIEFAGLGPVPFCGMLLSDMGAEVLRIDRPDSSDYRAEDVESRGRHSLVVDLKQPSGVDLVLALIEKSDMLLEGFRPGVMERFGLGPIDALALNSKLVYGRMTGWGQDGPMSNKAGHDLNYLAITGALHALGTRQKPAIPLNLIADFGGGALYLAMGMLAALHSVQNSGNGQVVDCAMSEGVISMLGMIFGDFAVNKWQDQRESNVIDGGAPFYNVYQCADGQWISLAAIEPQFYAGFLAQAGITDDLFQNQWDKQQWPELKRKLEYFFSTRSRDKWCQLFEHSDVCIAPVLNLAQAQQYQHNVDRSAFATVDGIIQPAPAPRFSKTPSAIQFGPLKKGQHSDQLWQRWGISPDRIEQAKKSGAL